MLSKFELFYQRSLIDSQREDIKNLAKKMNEVIDEVNRLNKELEELKGGACVEET